IDALPRFLASDSLCPGRRPPPRLSTGSLARQSARLSTPPGLAGGEVRLGHVRVELDSVARLVLDREVPVLEERAVMQHEVLPPIDIYGELVDPEVAHRRGGVTGGNGADRARRVVGRRPDVVVVGHVVYAFRFQQPARLRNVEVDRVTTLQLDQA